MDYKKELKSQIAKLQKEGNSSLTLKKLASHLQIQYTYLSRILNSNDEHLKEDVLYEALTFLNFSDLKINLLMNYRILSGSSSVSRKKVATEEIAKLTQSEFQEVEKKGKIESQMMAETVFMLDPYASIILASLSIPHVKNNVRSLMHSLGLTLDELKLILDKIEAAGFIERGDDLFDIKKIKSSRLHFQIENQLMRIHQQQLKQLSNSFLSRLSENNKRSFMVTFAADEKLEDQVKDEFNRFIKKIETLSKDSKAKKTYQLNFDFFSWI